MQDTASRIERLAAVVALAKEIDRPTFGRTALMKCAYFLQTLKRVPLGYRFRLYTYGPYDSDVLQDLDYADILGALDVNRVDYPTGYGYSIRAGANAEAVLSRARTFLDVHQAKIKEIATEFGDKSATELELDSAVLYVSMSPDVQPSARRLDKIVEHVHAIKPRFSEDEVRQVAKRLASSGYVAL